MVALCGAALLAGPAPVRAQPVPVTIDYAAVIQMPFRYSGVVPWHGVDARLLLGLNEDGNGVVSGAAVLLAPDGRVTAAGPVQGETQGAACRLQLKIGNEIATIGGGCTPTTISGLLQVATTRQTNLFQRIVDVIYWKFPQVDPGEVWLRRE